MISTATLIGMLGVLMPLAAGAVDAVTELRRLAGPGSAPRIGFVFLYDIPRGVILEVDAKGLTPGENAIWLVEADSCAEVAEAAERRILGTADVDVNEEEGTEDLFVSFTVPALTIDEMSGRALVVGPLSRSDGDAFSIGACGIVE